MELDLKGPSVVGRVLALVPAFSCAAEAVGGKLDDRMVAEDRSGAFQLILADHLVVVVAS